MVDGVVLDRYGATADLQALVVTELGGGKAADLDRELERAALGGKIGKVELGIAHGNDAGGVDGIGVPVSERIANRLLEHHLTTDALDDQWRGDLATTKAGELH